MLDLWKKQAGRPWRMQPEVPFLQGQWYTLDGVQVQEETMLHLLFYQLLA